MARSLDHSAGGSMHMRKIIEEVHELIEIVASNQHLYSAAETSMKGEVKAIFTESNPPKQDGPLTQQLHALAQQLLELQEVLRETQASNKNVEAQLSQTSQQLSKQITEVSGHSTEEWKSTKYPTSGQDAISPKASPSEKDKQFARFADYLKTLEIKIPFAEALEQIPFYAKFMKDILSHKKDWREEEIVFLIEECSAVIQRSLPEKLKDPESFIILCTLGDACTRTALCDLGTSINLIPVSLIKKLDFMVLEMDEHKSATLILGRPFLVTGRTLIDVKKGKVTLRVSEDEFVLNVVKAMKHPDTPEECGALISLIPWWKK
ncbi:uncharacterized protein LOC130963382 [Arachis stenosperma]|uniref:uncharacterized protein LOC130963382 n=1 Tax=Arachis stenosperma TaxID=217475 RepID=UPI0025ACD607|nr:uncharacterized protein LOC130963382 [Arachis stenosperma]